MNQIISKEELSLHEDKLNNWWSSLDFNVKSMTYQLFRSICESPIKDITDESNSKNTRAV